MASNEKPGDNSNLPRGLVSRGGTPTSKSTRLPSIRTPRDLTLGGVKKKTFVPNIPQRKGKSKTDDGAKASGSTPVDKGTPKPKSNDRRRDDNKPGRGRGRGKPEVIQSHSIFEQGPTEKVLKDRGSFPSYGGGGGGGGSSGGDGVSLKAKIKKEKPEETQRILDGLLRDDFIEDGDTDSDYNPVKLPLSACGGLKQELKPDVMETDGNASTADKVIPHVKLGVKDIECSELFTRPVKSENSPLLFFQLPDVLPGVLSSADDNPKPAKSQGQGQSQNEQENAEDNPHKNSLRDFAEGHIGKIQVLKSGKCRLVLGKVSLDVFMGTPCSFLQDVVSVKVDENVGDMKVLGHLDYRLVCSPDFESLLQSMS